MNRALLLLLLAGPLQVALDVPGKNGVAHTVLQMSKEIVQ